MSSSSRRLRIRGWATAGAAHGQDLGRAAQLGAAGHGDELLDDQPGGSAGNDAAGHGNFECLVAVVQDDGGLAAQHRAGGHGQG